MFGVLVMECIMSNFNKKKKYSWAVFSPEKLVTSPVLPSLIADFPTSMREDILLGLVMSGPTRRWKGWCSLNQSILRVTTETLLSFTVNSPQREALKGKSCFHVLPFVQFFCTFTTARSRFLREYDRRVHESCFPKLYYPELYLLEGGYRVFYEKYTVSRVCCTTFQNMFYVVPKKEIFLMLKVYSRHK